MGAHRARRAHRKTGVNEGRRESANYGKGTVGRAKTFSRQKNDCDEIWDYGGRFTVVYGDTLGWV
jgi:hypothetical protein